MIYYNALGWPNAEGRISVFGGAAEKEYYLLYTPNGYPSRSWNINTPLAAIITEMEKEGFTCSVKYDVQGKPVIKCIHIETQAFIDAEKQAQDIRFAKAEPGFIGYCEVYKEDKAKRSRGYILEIGVSCFRAEFTKGGSCRILLDPATEASHFPDLDWKPYRLYGEIVGEGANGAPLICVVRWEELAQGVKLEYGVL